MECSGGLFLQVFLCNLLIAVLQNDAEKGKMQKFAFPSCQTAANALFYSYSLTL